MTKYIVDEYALRALIESDLRLKALEIGGVDNWEWYSKSLRDDVPYDESVAKYYERLSLEHLQDYEQLIPNNGETKND